MFKLALAILCCIYGYNSHNGGEFLPINDTKKSFLTIGDRDHSAQWKKIFENSMKLEKTSKSVVVVTIKKIFRNGSPWEDCLKTPKENKFVTFGKKLYKFTILSWVVLYSFVKSIYLCTCFLLHQTAGNVVVSASKTCKPHTVQKVGKI